MILGYFLFKVIKYGIISFISDSTLNERFSVSMQCFDLLFLGGTLVIFRSRVWPSFYRIGLNEINVRYLTNNIQQSPFNVQEHGMNRNMLAPMLETNITKGFFNDDETEDVRSNSIGSDDVVVILNPTKYTIRDDEQDEDEDIDQVQSSLNDRKAAMLFKKG